MKMRKFTFLFLTAFCLLTLSNSADWDDLIDRYAPREKSPRPLNTEDVHLISTTPQPVLVPTGDFNNDGVADVAVSGVYNLPGNGPRYFLLVGTIKSNQNKPLFFQEYAKPVFLHNPGSTGEADPGDQCFALSFCLNCDQGYDFYWDPKRKSFTQKEWRVKTKRTSVTLCEPAVQVSTETADMALKIVGLLKDVQNYVSLLKKGGGTLGTRVRPTALKDTVEISIYEKKKGKELEYDVITVDISRKTITSRKRKGKKRLK